MAATYKGALVAYYLYTVVGPEFDVATPPKMFNLVINQKCHRQIGWAQLAGLLEEIFLHKLIQPKPFCYSFKRNTTRDLLHVAAHLGAISHKST